MVNDPRAPRPEAIEAIRAEFTNEVIRAIGALARQQNVCREQGGVMAFVTGMDAAREFIVEHMSAALDQVRQQLAEANTQLENGKRGYVQMMERAEAAEATLAEAEAANRQLEQEKAIAEVDAEWLRKQHAALRSALLALEQKWRDEAARLDELGKPYYKGEGLPHPPEWTLATELRKRADDLATLLRPPQED